METLPRGPETILLVDADPETRKLAAFMLEKRGYRVLEARSCADALRVCENGARPDLVLTEVLMPDMSGTALATKLAESQPDLRVLYMSRADYNRVVRRMDIDRKTAFLQKPFTMVQIANKVRHALDARASGMRAHAG